jgi:hypothetical protein
VTINRIVVLVAAIFALLGAAAPIIADADWQSTVGIVTGILALVKLVDRWLKGWQAHEDRAHWRENSPAPAEIPAVFSDLVEQVRAAAASSPADRELQAVVTLQPKQLRELAAHDLEVVA